MTRRTKYPDIQGFASHAEELDSLTYQIRALQEKLRRALDGLECTSSPDDWFERIKVRAEFGERLTDKEIDLLNASNLIASDNIHDCGYRALRLLDECYECLNPIRCGANTIAQSQSSGPLFVE